MYGNIIETASFPVVNIIAELHVSNRIVQINWNNKYR